MFVAYYYGRSILSKRVQNDRGEWLEARFLPGDGDVVAAPFEAEAAVGL